MAVTKKQPGWINRTGMAATMGISVVTLDRWLVPSVGKVRGQKFFTGADVLENRLADQKRRLSREVAEVSAPDSTDMEVIKREKLKEETRRLKLQNAILDGRSLPAWAVTEILTSILSQAGVLLDTLPSTIQRQFPDIEKRVIDGIESTVIQCMNEISRLDDRIDETLEIVKAEAADKVR